MIRPLLLTAPLFACLSLAAAEPVFDWLASGGGARSDKIRAVTFGKAADVFLAGETTGDGQYGDVQRLGAGETDFVLMKLSPTGELRWLRSLGGAKVDRGYGVATDAAGDVYVTGHHQSTDAKANDEVLPNAGDYDVFVAKYSAAGDLLWVRTAGGAGYDYGHGIVVDAKGAVVVTGAVAGPAHFGAVAVNAGASSRAIFCAKYDAGGNLLWVRATEGKLSGSGHGISTDAAGHLYIGGNGSGSGQWGSHVMDLGARASVVLKLTSEGEPVWSAIHPGAGVHEITADATGRVWAAGMFKGSATFGTQTFSTTGDKDNDGFLCHYSPDGALQWTRVLSGPGTDYCLGVATDDTGRVFMTGEFSGTARFGNETLVSQGATDILTAAFDPAGALAWRVVNGGPKGDNAYTIAWHASGRLVIGGSCSAPAGFGRHLMSKDGGSEAYGAVLKLP
jgi:hypothetical protein